MTLKAPFTSSCSPGLWAYASRLKSDSMGARLARGTLWSLMGTIIARLCSVLVSIVVARSLGKVQFGELGIIQSTVNLFGLFAGFGMGLTATKFVAEFRQKDPARVASVLSDTTLFSWVSGGVLASGLLCSAPWLAAHTLAAPHLGWLLRASAPLLVLTGWQGVLLGALSGFESFKRIAQVNAVTGILTSGFTITGTLLWGIQGAIWASVAAQLLVCLLTADALKKTASAAGIQTRFSPWLRDFHLVWRFSFPALISGVMVVPVNWLCNALLVNQPFGYGEMGLLNVASQWRNSILFLPSIVSSVSLPLLSGLGAQNDRSTATRLVWNSIKINTATALVAVGAVSVLSPFIMASYGMGGAHGNLTLIVLCFSALLSGTIGIMGQYIASRGMMWWGMLLNMIWGCALVIAAWELRNLGALGIAWANLISYTIHLITVGLFTYRFLPKASIRQTL